MSASGTMVGHGSVVARRRSTARRPYRDLLVDELTVDAAAGARPTMIGLVIVFTAAPVTAVPALVWQFVLVNQRDWHTDSN